MPNSQVSLFAIDSFGELLKFLRVRARLTQRELSIAAGYSEAQISRLENNQRPPDLAALQALIIPALGIDDQPEVRVRLLELAAGVRDFASGEPGAANRPPDETMAGLIDASLGPAYNLPVQLTSFVGREREVSAVRELLETSRLVTLHGSGGTGKTRLSLEVAAQVLGNYPDGVRLVELAPLADGQKIPQLIVSVFGLNDSSSRSAVDFLMDYLFDKRVLILLDNCEHLIDDCARLVDRLLRECPLLSVLATSREALAVPGEITYHVPSLSLPGPEPVQPLETVAAFEAVRLFSDRTASILPDFALTAANAPAVVQICRRLDGIPLAIELAAARMDVLSPQQIAARLDDRFRLLAGGTRTALPRQQTLRASIDWSYSLLSQAECLLLQRLSVFSGGWTLEAAEEVCGFTGLIVSEILDTLAQLVKKSLVLAERPAGGMVRYRMLETIRQFAREKLIDAGEQPEVLTRHLNYYVDLAEQAEPELRGPDQVGWKDRLEAEIDNLRSALDWSREENPHKGMRLSASLLWFWRNRAQSSGREVLGWLEQALAAAPLEEHAPPQQVRLWAKALAAHADLATSFGRTGEKVTREFEAAQSFFEKLGPAARGELVLFYHTWARNLEVIGGHQTEYYAMMRKSLAIAEELGDRFGIAECLPWVDWSDDLADKLRIALRSLALRREIGDLEGIWWDLSNLARIYYAQGDFPQALQTLNEAIKICHQVKNTWGLSLLAFYQGLIYSEMDRFAEAVNWLERAVQLSLVFGGGYWAVFYEISLAGVLQRSGSPEAAQIAFREAFENALKGKYHMEQSIIRFCQAEIAWAQADTALAEQYYRETIRISQENNLAVSALGLYGLGKIALARGDCSAAWDHHRQAIQTWIRSGTKDHIPQALTGMAVVAASSPTGDSFNLGVAGCAARLHGAGQGLGYLARLVYLTRPHFESYNLEACLAPARAALGEEAYARAFAEGQAMNLDQAIAYALSLSYDLIFS